MQGWYQNVASAYTSLVLEVMRHDALHALSSRKQSGHAFEPWVAASAKQLDAFELGNDSVSCLPHGQVPRFSLLCTLFTA